MQKRFWLIDLERLTGLPQHWAAVVAGLAMLGLTVAGWFATPALARSGELGFGGALFFATTVALLVGLVHRAVAVTQANLQAVRGSFACDDETFAGLVRAMEAPRGRTALMVLLMALPFGFAHDFWVRGSTNALIRGWEVTPYLVTATIGTLAIWALMFQLSSLLIDNANAISRFCREHLRVQVLDVDALAPLGRIALQPALMLLGVQAVYPLLWIDGDVDFGGVLPGFVATLGVLFVVLFLPLRGARERIRAARDDALAEVRRELAGLPFSTDAPAVARLNELAALKAHLLAVHEWPINAPVLRRLGFYVVIPPVAWVGAAFVEMAVDALL